MSSPTEPDPHQVTDHESAVRFIQWCVDQLGFGFHPDTRFGDYQTSGGQPFFSGDTTEALDLNMKAAFTFCDPYEVGMEEFERLKRELP